MALVKVTILAEDKTGAAVDRAKRKAQELEQAAQKVSSAMKTAGIVAAGAAVLALKSFADFDKGIREVGTLLSDVTESSLAQMGKEIKTLSVEFGQALDVMTKAKYDVVSAGFKDAADSALILETSAKLASGGVAQVSETADVLTTVLNAYGSSAAKVEDVSDKLFKTVELGKTRIDLLAGALGTVVAIAPTVGVGFDEVSAAMATLTAIGQSTDESATALQATMTALLKPSEDMNKALKSLGFETGVAAVRAMGFTETIKALTDGVNEAELAARFPNVRAMRAVFPLIGEAAGKFNDNLEQIRNSAGATDTAFEKMAGSASFQLAQLKERGRIALIDLGAAVAPLLSAFTSLIESFTSMGGAAQAAVIALGGLILITAKLGPAILTLITGMSGATAATVGFGAALKALFVSNPIGLLITGLTLLVPAVIALDRAFGGAGNALRDFRKEAAGMNLLDAQNSVEGLNKELEETIKRRDMLLEKNAQEFVAKGQISIKGQEEIEAVNTKITELKNKIDIVSGQEIKIRASLGISDNVGTVSPAVEVKGIGELDRLRQGFAASSQEVIRLEAELAKLEKDLSGVVGVDPAPLNRKIEETKVKLQEAKTASETFGKQLESIGKAQFLKGVADAGIAAKQAVADLGGEVEKTSFKIPFQIDSADLAQKYRETLESLQKQSVTLTAKVSIERAIDGSVSEELQTEVGDVQKAISAIQKELNKLIPPMPKIDLGELQAVDLPTLAFEFDDASLKAAKAGVADVEAFRMQKAQEAQDFLNSLTLTADQMEIMRLQAQLTNLAAFSDQRVELETAAQERIAEIREEARAAELEAQAIQLEQQVAQIDQYVNQVAGIFDKYTQARIAAIGREEKAQSDQLKDWFETSKATIIQKNTVEGQLTEAGKAKLASLERAYQDRLYVVREDARKKEESAASAQKFIKVAQSISNTAVAVTKALPNLPLAAVVGAIGAVQTGLILAQPYATGGILGQNEKSVSGKSMIEFASIGSDKIPAMLSPGEAIIPAASVEKNRTIVEKLIAGDRLDIAPKTKESAQKVAEKNRAIIEKVVGNKSTIAPNDNDVVQKILLSAAGAILGQDRAMSPGEKIVEFMPVGSDSIPAMLSPGEAVIPAAAVQQNRDIVERMIAGATINTPVMLQSGGIVGSAAPVVNESRTVVNETNAPVEQTYITINNQITSQSLDPAGAAVALRNMVNSDEFMNPFRDAVNRRDIRIEVNSQVAEIR